MRACLWKSDRWLPSYAPKTILGPFAPNLGTRTHSSCETKFSNKQTKNWWSVVHKILNKTRGCLWKSGNWLPSCTQKIILGLFAPNLHTKTQPPWGSKFTIKKSPVFFMKFWIKWGVVCENLTCGCHCYDAKTILGPFTPNLHTRTQSPCEAKFSKKKCWS